MATFQTQLQDATARMKGSGVLYVLAYSATIASALSSSNADAYSWTNVGSVTGLKIDEQLSSVQLQGDNAEEEKYVSDQKVVVGFEQREAALEVVREIVRGSTFDTITTTAGSLVSGASQVVSSGAWNYKDFIEIENQNGDGSAITVNSVTGATDGALTVDVDFWVGRKSDNGPYGIFLDDSNVGTSLTTEAQNITINYDYTPNASKTIYSGGKTELPYFHWKIVNTDESDNVITIYGFKAALDQGYSFTYKPDDADDPIAPNSVQFTSVIDRSISTKGKQLFKIYTERGI